MKSRRSPGASIRVAVSLAWLLASAPGAAQDAGQAAPLGVQQIEQLVAPIALYPDSLLAQALMASTYPLEVVEAARWVKANPKVTGQALEQAMQQQSWDASVKSLTAFPQTLEMMDAELDWTTQLGNAFLAQQADVMNAVQVLRQRAQAAGNLASNEQQKVVVEQNPAGSQPQTIIIEPASPQIVYVPTYNPTVVYGPWPYRAYPPVYWYPPGYAATASIISFGVGLAVGSALWGGCNWGRSDVNINVNQYNSFNRTNISSNSWQHNSVHRKGVQYRDQSVRDRYGKNDPAGAKARESFRGRAEQGREQIARGDADRFKGAGDRPGGGGQRQTGARSEARPGGREPARKPGSGGAKAAQRPSTAQRGGGAFAGVGNGGEVKQQASRGRSSRAHSASLGGGGRGGGGGGGQRGGGGGGRRR
jgi:Protein of unknown function (DUF3300)